MLIVVYWNWLASAAFFWRGGGGRGAHSQGKFFTFIFQLLVSCFQFMWLQRLFSIFFKFTKLFLNFGVNRRLDCVHTASIVESYYSHGYCFDITSVTLIYVVQYRTFFQSLVEKYCGQPSALRCIKWTNSDPHVKKSNHGGRTQRCDSACLQKTGKKN